MAIVIDQLTIGSRTDVPPGTATTVLTTTAVVAANGFIVLCFGGFLSGGGGSLTSVGGGGLSWAIDKQGQHGGGSNNSFCGIASAQAPDGLASATAITLTWVSTSVEARSTGAMSFKGVATSAALDTTSGPTDDVSTTAWTTASTAIQAGSVLIGSCMNEVASGVPTSTITAPSIESYDVGDVAGYGGTGAYRIESAAASYTVAGTWSASLRNVTTAAAYKVAGAVTTPADNPPFGVLGRGAGW